MGQPACRSAPSTTRPGRGGAPADKHRVRFSVETLKHTTELSLPGLDAWFAAQAAVCTGFAIEYRIHPASTPEIKSGKVHVTFDVIQGHVRFPFTEERTALTDVEEIEEGSGDE